MSRPMMSCRTRCLTWCTAAPGGCPRARVPDQCGRARATAPPDPLVFRFGERTTRPGSVTRLIDGADAHGRRVECGDGDRGLRPEDDIVRLRAAVGINQLQDRGPADDECVRVGCGLATWRD